MGWEVALFFWVGVPLAAAAVAAAVRWRRRRGVGGQIRRASLQPAAALRPGSAPVAVQGRTRALATLEAPVSGRTVIGFRLTIEYTDAGGREENSKRRMLEASRIVEFEVADDSGAVRVRGSPALLMAATRAVAPDDLTIALTRPSTERLILEQGISALDLVAARNVTVCERLLLPDSPVYVCGVPFSEVASDGAAAGYRAPPSRIVIKAAEKEPLLIADCHRDELLKQLGYRLG